jgi:PAS domain S-box-containing protein
MSFVYLVYPSAGSVSVAFLAASIFILQIWLSTRRAEFRWCRWAAAISFSTILYSVGIFFEYTAPEGPINRFGGLLEWTAVIFLVHALYGYIFSRLNIPSGRYHYIAGGLHFSILALLWSTPIFVSDHFVVHHFLTLERPFVEAGLGPLGPVFVLYALGAAINAIRLWIVKGKAREVHSRADLWGAVFWIIMGAHDGLVALGFSSFQYVMEYGFLGFSAALFYIMFSDYSRLADTLEHSNIILQKEMETRKLVEEELKESEERFREMAENVRAVFWLTTVEPGPKGRILYINNAVEEIFGIPREALYRSEQDWVKVLHEDDRKRVLKAMNNLLEGNAAYEEEFRIVRPDGSIRWIHAKGSPIRNDQGEIVRLVGTASDITERKRAEEALAESEKRYRELADSLPQTIFETDREGNITYTNCSAFSLFGFTHADFEEGLNVLQMIVPEDRKRGRMNIERVLAGETLGGMEYTARKKEGSTFPVVIYSSRMIREDKPVGLRGVLVDISKIKEAEKALVESEAKFRSIFENAMDAIFLAAPDGRVFSANPAACKMTDYSESEIRELGREAVIDLMDPRLPSALEKRREPGLFKGELLLRRKDGTTFPAEITSTIFRDKDGQERTIIIARDRTEPKRAELELQKSEALHKEAQRVAHIGHWELEADMGTPVWSEEIFRIFGLDPGKGEPSFVDHETCVHPEDWPTLDGAVRKAGQDGTPFDLVFRIVKPGGEMGWMHAIGTTSRDEQGNVTKLFGTAQDITALRQTEEALRKSEKRLRILTSQLFAAEEEQRKRISLELHDELGQTLAAIQFNLEAIEEELPSDAAFTTREKLEETGSIVDQASEKIHELSILLRPPMLDDLGLVSTLRWNLNRFSKMSNLEIKFFATNFDERVDQDTETVLYRVVQEALNNVAKHAEAKRVLVELHRERDVVACCIEDDGKGFDVNETLAEEQMTARIGLQGMRHRVSLLKGSLAVDSRKGHGTRISVEIPLRSREVSWIR